MSGSPSELFPFVYDELASALREQSFGITSAEIVASTQFQATACVVLLEGEAISVSLTTQHFKLDSITLPWVDSNIGTTFETIEELLQAVSPMYGHARRDALLAKLQILSESMGAE